MSVRSECLNVSNHALFHDKHDKPLFSASLSLEIGPRGCSFNRNFLIVPFLYVLDSDLSFSLFIFNPSRNRKKKKNQEESQALLRCRVIHLLLLLSMRLFVCVAYNRLEPVVRLVFNKD